MSFDKHLRQLSRGLRSRSEEVPSELRVRVFGSLPESPYKARKTPSRAVRLALLAGIGGLVVGSYFMAPARVTTKPALAAEVQAAVVRANTWHFSGWRIKDDKKVRWEVWGRRTPFFYREQVGDEILLDDGKTQTHILPAKKVDSWLGAQPGVVLTRPSSGENSFSLSDPRAAFLVGIGGETNQLRPAGGLSLVGSVKYMGSTITDETTLLTVSQTTHLPQHYTVRRIESKPEGTVEKGDVNFDKLTRIREYIYADLTARYDVALPADVESFTVPEGYSVADMTTPAQIAEATGPASDRKNGLTLKANVIGQDKEGNVLLRFQGWMGKQPMNYRLVPFHLEINRIMAQELAEDTLGRKYFFVSDSGNYDGEKPELWLAPAEPYSAGDTRPRDLTVHLDVKLSGYERMGNSGRSVPVVSESMKFTVELPEKITTLDYEAPYRWSNFSGKRPTFAQVLASNRAQYYMQKYAGGKEWQRAADWWEIARQEAEKNGDKQSAEMYRKNAETFRNVH